MASGFTAFEYRIIFVFASDIQHHYILVAQN